MALRVVKIRKPSLPSEHLHFHSAIFQNTQCSVKELCSFAFIFNILYSV